jgi:hypothetical protein
MYLRVLSDTRFPPLFLPADKLYSISSSRVTNLSSTCQSLMAELVGYFASYKFAQLMGEQNGLCAGLQAGREQWNLAAIPTILTVRQH